MNKCIRLMKRMVALSLVLLLSIESFAAVVSDNDGSAFITKAEFDSLKNNFQSQIDQYNTSIDSKIDGAIASYLSGVKFGKTQTLINSKSNLSYPLTMQMQNRVLNFSGWNKNTVDVPYYTPTIKTDWWWTRFDVGTWRVKVTPERRLDWFYNGSYVPSIDKYVLKSRLIDFDILWSIAGSFYVLADTGTSRNIASYNINFFLDSKTRKARGNQGTGWITRDNEWAEFEIKYLSSPGIYTGSDCPFVIDAFYEWSPTDITNDRLLIEQVDNDPYRKIRYNRSVSDNWYEGTGIENYELSISQSYKDAGINFLMNANASDKSIEVPVAYDYRVWFVNKYNFKQDLLKDYSPKPLRDQSNYASYKHAAWHIFSTGFTIEPQFSTNTNTNKWERSLLEPKDIVYEVIPPETNQSVLQQMNHGILISEISDEADFGDIELDITSSDIASVPKYLVMSDKAIEIENINEIDDGNKKDFFILSDSRTSLDDKLENRKYELKNGTNKVYFTNKDLKKELPVYFKIIWTDVTSHTSQCIINKEPELTIQTTG